LVERKDVLDYLHSRGATDETIKTWRLGFAPANWSDLSAHLVGAGFAKDDIVLAGLASKSEKRPGEVYDRFRGRIMFPIADPMGRIIAFSGRFFEHVPGSKEEGEPAKYVNSPETPLFKKSKTLYGFDHAKGAIRKADCILLVEGQFDLVLAHQSALPFAVALSGTALTEEHLTLLSRLSKRLVLALDADAAGVRAGLRSAEMALKAGFDVKIPTFPDGKDPADLAREKPELLKAAIRTSTSAVEFFMQALRGSARDEQAYKRVVEATVLPLIAAIESKIEQEHFVHVVAQRLGVSESAVASQLAKRPKAPERAEDPVLSETQARIEQTPLERAVAMLMVRSSPESVTFVQLQELVGKDRIESLQPSLLGEEERLRFEFDLLGEDEAVVTAGLLHTIERKIIQEKIAALQHSLRSGGDPGLLKDIASLKQREQELRN
jgi:DNA primase